MVSMRCRLFTIPRMMLLLRGGLVHYGLVVSVVLSNGLYAQSDSTIPSLKAHLPEITRVLSSEKVDTFIVYGEFHPDFRQGENERVSIAFKKDNDYFLLRVTKGRDEVRDSLKSMVIPTNSYIFDLYHSNREELQNYHPNDSIFKDVIGAGCFSDVEFHIFYLQGIAYEGENYFMFREGEVVAEKSYCCNIHPDFFLYYAPRLWLLVSAFKNFPEVSHGDK